MSDDAPKCPSCGMEYTHHLGLIGMCAELQSWKASKGWREPQPADSGKYAFIESLPDDAAPTLIRCSTATSYRWQYWTPSGWADLTSRVCVCERPE